MAGAPVTQAKWRALVQGTYLTISDCPTCASPRLCSNYFCVECEVGGLCPATFQLEQPHWQHPWIKVVKVTRECAVNEDVLIRFIGRAESALVQKYKENQKRTCFLKTRAKGLPTKPSLREVCRGCGYLISASDAPTKGTVCSVECLLRHAERNPDLGLVRLLPSCATDVTDPPSWCKPKANAATKAPVDLEPSGESDNDEPSSESLDSEVQSPIRYRSGRPAGGPGPRNIIIRDYSGFSNVRQRDCLDILICAFEATGEWKRILGSCA